MDLAPGYAQHMEKLLFIGKHLSGHDSALEIGDGFTCRLFEVERFGFKNLVTIGKEFEDHFQYYIGYQEEQALINGERFEKKPLNRIFKAKYSFINGDLLTYDFKERKFDLVLCGYYLNSLPFEKQPNFIKRMSQLQSPLGLAEVNFHSLEYAHSKHAGSYIPLDNNILKNKHGEGKLYLANKEVVELLFSQHGYLIITKESENGVNRFLLKKIN